MYGSKKKLESRGRFGFAWIWLFKRGVTSDRRDRLQPGIIARRGDVFLTGDKVEPMRHDLPILRERNTER